PLNRAEEYSVKLVNKKFEPVASESLLNETARDTLGDEIQVESRLRFDRNKPFIQLHFVPLKTNPATGNIEKLVEFSISLERKGVDMKSLRKSTDKKTESSLLAQGRWVKIRVKQNGIYKISYSKLKDLGFDHPENIGIYGNSCGLLNVSNDTTKDYRLQQIPVEFVKGSDGVFSKGDHVLFYARGPNVWNYDENKEMFVRNGHPYTEYGYYFIGGNPRSKNLISGLEAPAGDPAELITSFIDYTHHEERNRNLIESGQEWVGEYFDVKLSHDFDFEFPNIVADAPVRIKGDFVSRSSYESRFEVISGNQNIISVDIPSVNYDYTGYFARQKSGYGEYFPESDQVSLEVVYDKGTPSARGWLNYLTVNAHRQLKMKGNQMQFRYRSEEAPKVVEFELEQAPDNLEIWDVTSDRETRKIDDFERNGNTVRFKINADTVFREFIAFNHKEYPEPEILGEIENQNLQGLGPKDMLIVTKNRFTAEAKELADIHRETDDFKISVVTDEQIYNEFSSGKSDPSAIRNFVRMIYNKSIPGDSLKYLLLFGDGSYDNLKSCESPYLMTYQSKQSFNYSRSFVSDDFFGLLDPEDHIRDEPSGLIDIGIGRFPVKNREEARNVVDKVKRYLNPDNWGAWLSNLCFAADDQDNNLHMRDADKLTKYVNGSHPRFNIRKIYLDSYRQQNTATGSVYPEVNRDINENINNGILLFNYTGHGGENHLAHERVLTKDDIEKWKNPGKMPLFMTATCEFTRFDDPDYVSAGEEVFLKPDGGSIALFSTTRLVYASLNYDLNRTFYDYVFEKDQNGEPLRFGDIVRLTKNYTGTSNNKRNFSLIGDPALKMPLGEYGIHTDSIVANNSQRSDTLHALDKITVYGQVVDKKGKRAEHFNGSLNIKLFDKAVPKTTLGNDGGSAFTYQARNNILFSGESKVKAGTFRGEFIIPKTILPDLGKGKLMYFGKERSTLAQGHYSDFYVGGYTERKLNDSQGPDIEIYMNDRDFVSGGITDEDPLLLAKLKDSSGINVSSAGIGQDLVMVLDNDHQDKRVLNRYYNADQNSYQKGEVRYQMSGLEKGQHELMLKAWDINENSSTERIEFTVAESDRLQIRKLLNYPNPFTENTAFYFEHNHPATNLDMLIQIFTISGKLVKTIQRQIQTDGFRAGPIHWDGRDDFGDKIGKGVYLYKIKIRSDEGESAEKIQKLVILK
ncbi:MAG: type IX secretion system sortase PorU, partial [Bacteroidota bacterium]